MSANLLPYGYLFSLVQPLATVLGFATGWHWLGFAVFAGFFSVARKVCGEQEEGFELRPWQLHAVLALQVGVVLLGLVASTCGAVLLGQGKFGGWGAASLWATLALGTTALHALGHARPNWQRVFADFMAGWIAYPLINAEHKVHHQISGLCEGGRTPGRTESAYRFIVRRLSSVPSEGLAESAAIKARKPDTWSPLQAGLIGSGIAAAIWSAGGAVAGYAWSDGGLVGAGLGCALGAMVHLALTAAVFVAVQLVTYAQHWGLGDDTVPNARRLRLGWQDTCRLQRWVTFDLSLHFHHHLHPSAQPHTACLLPGAPVAPASYLLLMVLALWPAKWFELMNPILDRWLQDRETLPELRSSRITCFRSLAN